MATWTLTGQRSDGTSTVTIGTSDRLWFTAGTSLTNNILLEDYQDGFHVSDSSDAHSPNCGSGGGHLNNVKFVSNNTASINGASAVSLASNVPTQAQFPLKFTFSDAASVTTGAAKFYAYDGTTDQNPAPALDVKAIQKGDTVWSSVNGSESALNLGDQTAATSHDFFIAVSISPNSVGNKTGKFKIVLTYV